MRMARVNVYLPDDLAEQARQLGLNISRIARHGVEHALELSRADRWLEELGDLPATGVTHEQVLRSVSEAKEEIEAS